jgi:hypothetical protein
LYKYFACIAFPLIPKVGRKHIWYAFFDWVALFAGFAAQLAGHNLPLVLLEDLQREVAFTEGTGKDIKKIALHESGDVFLRSINFWIQERKKVIQNLIPKEFDRVL